MKLSRAERLILSNQYRILEALYPKEKEHLAEERRAIEHGYELQYDEITQHIYDGLTEKQCEEVLEILDLHRSLKFSYDALPDKTGIEPRDAEFHGFDGNGDDGYMGYARYFCEHDGGRFQELARGDNFNSHFPMLPRYRKMVEMWKYIGQPREMGKDQILQVIRAK